MKKGVVITMIKTNVMRLLEQAAIPYRAMEYEVDENNLAGEHVADLIGMPAEQVFKTLVAKGEKKGIVVFCIPVSLELNLKKAALVIGDKKIEMLPVKDLLGTTGYIRGGCSPIGMKKKFPTYVDETAILFDEITVSAGVRGCQLCIHRDQLIGYIEASLCDIAE
jgi:Cys-tRNA(Pro)/Cys-tRNA(Cys) deacylase